MKTATLNRQPDQSPSHPSHFMKLKLALLLAVAGACSVFAVKAQPATADKPPENASPVYGVTLPEEYRRWEMIAPAVEGEPLNELRVIVGNSVAIKAYQEKTLPFPDGSVLVKLAWKRIQSPEFEPASIPGPATTVQVMVKDSKKYPDSGGWGFGRFIDGKPADTLQHQSCFACHQALVKNHDFVFTRLAP